MTKISIFLPYYNDEDFIAQTISSILNQTYKDFELVLFNHASTDSSREIAHSFDDTRIRHIDSCINYGAGSGLNFWNNLSSLHGKYIKIFCADDIMIPTHLEELIDYMENNPEKDFVISSKAQYIDENGNILENAFDHFYKHDINNENLRYKLISLYFQSLSIIPWGGALIKKEALNNITQDNSLIYLFDVTFWLNLLLRDKKIGLIDKSLYFYRKHQNAMMTQNITKVNTICYYEHLTLNEIFYKIKDIDIVKYLCKDIENIDILDEDNLDLIPYFIAIKSFKQKVIAYNYPIYMTLIYRNNAYMHLYNMLQDRTLREKLSTKLNFTIKDFRDLYSEVKETRNIVTEKINILQQIFSVKNKDSHKILRLLGFKIKFKRKIKKL